MKLAAHSLGQDMHGDEVRLLHAELARLGIAVPETESSNGQFGAGTISAVREFQKANALPASGVVDALTARAISTAVNALRPAASTIFGRVYNSERVGVAGLTVHVVDKNVGADVLLAEGTTTDRGEYSVLYSTEALTRRGKSAPDLQVRVLANGVAIGVSSIRYDASAEETLDITLPDAAAAALPTEFETLTAGLSGHFEGSLRELQESNDPGALDARSDITYLASKTEWDARVIALAAIADDFSHRAATAMPSLAGGPSVIPAHFFYALFRAGLPTDERALYATDTGTLMKAWTAAIDQRVIPAGAASQLPAVVKQFEALAIEKLLNGPAAVAGVSSFKDLLVASGLSPAQQAQFASLYTAQRHDMPEFWKSVTTAFGSALTQSLQLDGKLAHLTLDNVPLLRALRLSPSLNGQPLSDLAQLAGAGFHRPDRWKALLTADIQIPSGISGTTPEERKARYAAHLAAQIRLSYPTASIAQMVGAGDLRVDVPDQVQRFLMAHQDSFRIGVQPVEQYIAKSGTLSVPKAVVSQVKRLERLYRITPGDAAMATLLERGVDSAFQVVQQHRDTFIQSLSSSLATDDAAIIYDRALHVHNAALNIAVSYMTSRNGFTLGATPVGSASPATSGGQVLRSATNAEDLNGDVLAYPTLESLFRSMDYCACDHCRSALSPAAYLVDLLRFIDQEPTLEGKRNPKTVLLRRRPDIEHLPLTCENTNTALPYIDVVNEALEYWVTSSDSLADYQGHDTGSVGTEDLLASPQYVTTAAYDRLRGEVFPLPLPFHQPLESLRLHFERFEVPLAQAMSRLRRVDDAVEGEPYGWLDISMEELRLSREEYRLLTRSTRVSAIFGFPPESDNASVILELSNAKALARRLAVSYEDLVAILKTRFFNPNSDLLPKLERLGVSFATLRDFKAGVLSNAQFDALLPRGARAPDPTKYDGDIKRWVKRPDNFGRIMSIIVLSGPSEAALASDFSQFELRYSNPAARGAEPDNRLSPADFVRLSRFVRLWKKLDWSIEQVDAALCSLFSGELKPLDPDELRAVASLNAGFARLLPRLGVAVRTLRALGLSAQRGLLPLLACWSDLSTHGDGALYRQLFLSPTLIAHDPAFADDGYGNFPAQSGDGLLKHTEALRAALNLTADELDRIGTALGFQAETPLTLKNITALYRYGWLARQLRISVQEFIALSAMTGINVFAAPDLPDVPMERFIALVQSLKARSLRPEAALYLIWNHDLGGRAAPDVVQLNELARTMRADFAAIDDELRIVADDRGSVARAQVELVYGQEVAATLFALLDDTVVLNVDGYTHAGDQLGDTITEIDAALTYDRFQHRLSHLGLLSAERRDDLKAVPDVLPVFKEAIDSLFAQGQDVRDSFLARFPEFGPIYTEYVGSTDSNEKKRAALLAGFIPELAKRRKRQHALQRLATATGVDVAFAQRLLAPIGPPPFALPSLFGSDALDDFLVIADSGLRADIFFRDTATGERNQVLLASNLRYSKNSNPLPSNPVPGAAISGIWTGRIEAPETGHFNLVIDADLGATVSLSFDGKSLAMLQTGKVWRNVDALSLQAGVLYGVAITVAKVKDRLRICWETPKRAREVIPGRYLWFSGVLPGFTRPLPRGIPSDLETFQSVYVGFLKVTALASALRLTANELSHLGSSAALVVEDLPWLSWLSRRLWLSFTGYSLPEGLNAGLVSPLEHLLGFARLKAELSPDDERLIAALKDLSKAEPSVDGLLSLTGWNREALDALRTAFGIGWSDLASIPVLCRVYDAFHLIQRIGLSPAAALRAATNAPSSETVRELEAALRARHDPGRWRDLVRPIHDRLRSLQRDALVAHVLHRMQGSAETSAIDTPDKLFEYFLMDVQMDPSVQTSRVRHALSAIQLFVERCCMNLEGNVSPSSIDASKWAWMKRYRVWEAQRKIFLFPENWLEPELRDDKSPAFRDVESQLMQGDLTDESATSAFLTYVSKLEEVAKLEPCGMHYEEPTAGQEAVIHVVARTPGAPRRYYYRRFEHGTWSAWDPIQLEIPDNPVVPVVWQGRLLLLWFRVLKKGPDAAQRPSPDVAFASMTRQNLPPDPKFTSHAVLCWSEYSDGKWRAAKMSDVANPISLVGDQVLGLAIYTSGDALAIELAPKLFDTSYNGPRYVMHDTHSLPVQEWVARGGRFMLRTRSGDGFYYLGFQRNLPMLRVSASPRRTWVSIEPLHEPADAMSPPGFAGSVIAPFFYSDEQHTFLVASEQEATLVRESQNFGLPTSPSVAQPMQSLSLGQSLRGRQPRLEAGDTYSRHALPGTAVVLFNGARIGKSGALHSSRGREEV